MKRLLLPVIAITAAALVIKSKTNGNSRLEAKAYKLPGFSVSLAKKRPAAEVIANDVLPRRTSTIPAAANVSSTTPRAVAVAPSVADFSNPVETERKLAREIDQEIEQIENAWSKVRAKAYTKLGLSEKQLIEIAQQRSRYEATRDRLLAAASKAQHDQVLWEKIDENTRQLSASISRIVGAPNFNYLMQARDEFNRRIATRTKHGMIIGEVW